MLISLLTEKRMGVSSFPTTYNYRSIFSIQGQTLQLGRSMQATVELYSKQTRQLVDSRTSDANGTYKFTGLRKFDTYFVVSHHPENKYNAVIQDNIVPK